MSREEADAEETKKKSDDMRLTLAIQESREEARGQLAEVTRVITMRVLPASLIVWPCLTMLKGFPQMDISLRSAS